MDEMGKSGTDAKRGERLRLLRQSRGLPLGAKGNLPEQCHNQIQECTLRN